MLNLSEWLDSSSLKGIFAGLAVDLDPAAHESLTQRATPLLPLSAKSSAPHPQLVDWNQLLDKAVIELQAKASVLLSLNRSRRDTIVSYLHYLRLENAPKAPATLDRLEKWIDQSVHRPHGPEAVALHHYFLQVGIIWLAQAFLLKIWSERSLRPLQQNDLRDASYQVYQFLLPKMAGGKPWQITQSNYFSWFRPSEELQADTWALLGRSEALSASGGAADLLLQIKQSVDSKPRMKEYDSRFFEALWTELGRHRSTRGAIAFSPTLRFGGLVRNSPRELGWVGLEWNLFRLLISEVALLENEVQASPLWVQGTGIELFSKDQLELGLTSPRDLAFHKLGQLECFDFSVVLEETLNRQEDKTTSGEALRKYLADFTGLKPLLSGGTTLGCLQALIALTKLRPGGCLAWIREAPLSSREGEKLLSQLLGKAKLIAEWNFSEVEHQLPTQKALYPKYIYLFQREIDHEKKKDHLPIRIITRGTLRSHIDVVPMLQEAFAALESPRPAAELEMSKPWKLIRHVSPVPQSEWATRWPEPKDHEVLHFLDHLRDRSVALGQAVQVRNLGPKKTPTEFRNSDATQELLAAPSTGFSHAIYLGVQSSGEKAGHSLKVSSVWSPDEDYRWALILPAAHWLAPVRAYLESQVVTTWLTHYCEQKVGRWNLKETTLKTLPFPKFLYDVMSIGRGLPTFAPDPMFDADKILAWIKEASEISGSELAHAFWKVSDALSWIRDQSSQLGDLINGDGTLKWSRVLSLLPKKELVAFRLHSEVQVLGQLPPQIPVVLIKPVQSPQKGVLLSTENGMHVQIVVHHPSVQELLLSQLLELDHPTWNEIQTQVLLPRNLSSAAQTATEMVQFVSDQKVLHGKLGAILEAALGRGLTFRQSLT